MYIVYIYIYYISLYIIIQYTYDTFRMVLTSRLLQKLCDKASQWSFVPSDQRSSSILATDEVWAFRAGLHQSQPNPIKQTKGSKLTMGLKI